MPDTYTSQFSGEEIDSILRAVQILSGASTPAELRKKLEIRGDTIPVSAEDSTLISDAVKYRTNPNLLDNWYFGRPVNQRDGYIPKDIFVKAYNDVTCTDYAGPVNYYPLLIKESNGNFKYNIGSKFFYIKAEDTVSGYANVGYTVDRWKLDIGGAVTLEDGCICLKKSGTYCGEYFADFDQFIGMTLTGSVLLSDDTLRTGSFVYNGLLNQGQTFFSSELGFYVQALSDSLTQCEINSNVDNVKIKAVKLELGDTQTLAHKEGDKWVLNEIPDFGEQLRRCQRYYIDTLHIAVNESDKIMNEVWATGSTTGSGVHYSKGTQFPVIMRTIPVVTLYSVSSKTANKISYGSSGGDISATPTARFVGTTGFAQILINGVDDALNGNQIQFHYIASADL